MAAPIGPGDFVECIDVSMKSHNTEPPPLTLGAIYLVRAVGFTEDVRPMPGLALADAPPPYPGDFYRADRFRPIYKPDPNFIESLKREPTSPSIEEPKRIVPARVTQDIDGRGLVWIGDGVVRSFADVDAAYAFARQAVA